LAVALTVAALREMRVGREIPVFLCEMNDLGQRHVVLVDQTHSWRLAAILNIRIRLVRER